MIHSLKIGNKYLGRINQGTKTFEIRKNDRDFQVGDLIEFQSETIPRSKKYKITYITDYEQKPGYVVFSIQVATELEPNYSRFEKDFLESLEKKESTNDK